MNESFLRVRDLKVHFPVRTGGVLIGQYSPLKAVDGIRNVDTIIPGHADDPLTWEDLVDYAAFYDDLLTTVQQGAADGRSPAQIVDAYTVPDQYRDFQAPANRVESIVQLIHAGR